MMRLVRGDLQDLFVFSRGRDDELTSAWQKWNKRKLTQVTGRGCCTASNVKFLSTEICAA